MAAAGPKPPTGRGSALSKGAVVDHELGVDVGTTKGDVGVALRGGGRCGDQVAGQVLMGRCLIFPFIESTRCTLLTFLVVRLTGDRVPASGSAARHGWRGDEQPLTRAAAIDRAARTARRRPLGDRLHSVHRRGCESPLRSAR